MEIDRGTPAATSSPLVKLPPTYGEQGFEPESLHMCAQTGTPPSPSFQLILLYVVFSCVGLEDFI